MSASGWASGSAPESVGSASATTSGLSLCRAAASEIHVGRPATGGDIGATADAAPADFGADFRADFGDSFGPAAGMDAFSAKAPTGVAALY